MRRPETHSWGRSAICAFLPLRRDRRRAEIRPNAEGELLVPECPARHRLPHVEREANEGGPRTSQKGGQRAYKGPLGNGKSAP